MATILRMLVRYVNHTPKAQLLPYLYLLAIITGFSLSLLSFYIPALSICIPLFQGNTVCGPFGFYLMIFVSVVGYIAAALVFSLPYLNEAPNIITLVFVGVISLYFYHTFGRAIDKKTYKNFSSLPSLERIILISFSLLVLVFVYFFMRVQGFL